MTNDTRYLFTAANIRKLFANGAATYVTVSSKIKRVQTKTNAAVGQSDAANAMVNDINDGGSFTIEVSATSYDAKGHALMSVAGCPYPPCRVDNIELEDR